MAKHLCSCCPTQREFTTRDARDAHEDRSTAALSPADCGIYADLDGYATGSTDFLDAAYRRVMARNYH